jgi:hypothetical protein
LKYYLVQRLIRVEFLMFQCLALLAYFFTFFSSFVSFPEEPGVTDDWVANLPPLPAPMDKMLTEFDKAKQD